MERLGQISLFMVGLVVLIALAAVVETAEKTTIQKQDTMPGSQNQSGIAATKVDRDFKVEQIWITEDGSMTTARQTPINALGAGKKYLFHCEVSFSGTSFNANDKTACPAGLANVLALIRIDGVDAMFQPAGCIAPNEHKTFTFAAQGAWMQRLGPHEAKCVLPTNAIANQGDINLSNNEKSMNFQVVMK